jgi:hypothetical protein
MQLLMKDSHSVDGSLRASALALQLRMRAWTLFDTGVAGTACRGGVAVTGWAIVTGSAWVSDTTSARAAVIESRRGNILKQ